MLNRIVLIGRIVRDVDLRYSKTGTAVATFTLAVDRPYSKDREKETDFIPCVVWQKQAENCANYIGKGSLVAIDGHIQVRTYDDKDGQRKWVTEVVAERVKFLDKRGKDNNVPSIGEEVQFNEDEIPF